MSMYQHEREELGQAAAPPPALVVAPLTPGGVPAATRAGGSGLLIAVPPWLAQPANATGFNFSGQTQVNVGAAGVVVQVQVPGGSNAKLQAIGFSGPSGWLQYIVWTLLVNGSPLVAYNNLPAILGSLNEPERIEALAGPNDTVGILLSNVYQLTGGTFSPPITCQVFGYFYRGVN